MTKITHTLCTNIVDTVPNEPRSISIIKSGWDNKYHVICEDPSEGILSRYEIMTSSEIFECFNFDVTTMSNLKTIIDENPNNMDLGSAVKKLNNF